MEAYRNEIALVCIGLYFAMCIGVGLWAITRTKSTKDFFMAGRDLGIVVTAMAMFSSTLSGFGFVGGPGMIYDRGMSSVWMIVCGTVATCFSFYLVGKRLRIFAEVFDTVSLPGAVRARYNSETTRFLTAVAILFGVIGYLAAQTKAMAIVFQGIVNNIDGLPQISIETALAISVAVLIFYCVTGGIIAGVYTDLVQGIVMMIAGILVVLAAINAVDGGVSGAVTYIMTDDPEAAAPWGTLGALGAMSWYFLFVMGACGQPHAITKFMMAKKIKDLKKIMALSFVAGTLAVFLWIAIGLAMRALVVSGTYAQLGQPDDAASAFLQNFAHPLLAGVVFAALFAAIMSTADSFLNIGAAAIIHDIPKALIGRSLNNELMWARIATFGIAVFAALFVLYSNQDLVALLGTFGWGTFAAALVPTVAIGFNWKRATPMAANVAIVASLAANFAIELGDIQVPHGIHGGAIALVISLTLFFGISLMSKPPELSPEVEAIMDL
jgi:SSS family transporter